jgi:hypothetical protein
MARLDKLLKFLSLQSNSIICVSYSAPVTIHNSYLDSHPILVRHSWLHVGFVDNEVSDKDWWTKVTIGGRGENRKSMASLIMPVSGEIWKDQSSEKPMHHIVFKRAANHPGCIYPKQLFETVASRKYMRSLHLQ